MNPPCARCGKIVYPTEKVSCLDKNWHKGCFHCEVCKMTLNMKNYKGYEKKPYCNAHYPKTSFTIVADTPENLRLRQQSELQSQVKYKKDFEESKGRGFSMMSDTPELQRLRKTQEQISNAKYHEDFERSRGRSFTPGLDDLGMERYQRANQMIAEAGYQRANQMMAEAGYQRANQKMAEAGYGRGGVHGHGSETDRRPGGIIVDLNVWRADPGSIFDVDPLEDEVQSRSLRRTSERANRRLSRQQSQNSQQSQFSQQSQSQSRPQSVSSLTSDLWERSSADIPAPVLPGAYHHHQGVQQHQFHGYMHQTSMSSVRSVTSPPHSTTMRVYRALYDYVAQDHDEVSFQDGDVIVNAQPIDEGWMYGTVQRTGKSGMLPANYVECCN